ncbi:ubiquitin-specific protease OTU1 [Spizellomyces punctatus DAOM BR117]|uniref:Ubiquitin thioesterase OTU n=1 Tax=Spizellomyces punctatus (strain DAOM BR117) TaxID=645134 RepID=A0A0L0HA62_SPIPD|nr:ubiquitin-specific protease OTU1 [Spizellomyces punctatus DAOM BR117]KNC98445.1 hypothetical protein SPPG_06149 [Spizellomyces punctatus DAOM BR117]|eukprot:XP_016606485.1 hypothetical protein SPPG_06149 [Spizellomyces punctatus DAOM BR117]
MRLRCRTPKGQQVVGGALGSQSTLLELKREIEKVSGIPAAVQQLRFGFPPRPLPFTTPDSATLESCEIRDGEQLTVEQAAVSEQPVAGVTSDRKTGSDAGTGTPGLRTLPNGEGVPLEDGFLVVREMKDDNSCLFRSIGYVLERSPEAANKLRKIVADTIVNDPINYNEAILGRNPLAYREWILQPNSWGGAIELAIFSDHFQVEIDSIDVATLRIDRFGEGKYTRRVLILFSGIHYDAVALSPGKDVSEDFDQTAFEGGNVEKILTAGVELARIWNEKRKFTDLANFTLKCGICKKGLKGQKEAQAHALETGHASFTEYS